MNETFPTFLTVADAELKANGTYTVHTQGMGKPGKIYGCRGNNAYEALENAWEYLQELTGAIG